MHFQWPDRTRAHTHISIQRESQIDGAAGGTQLTLSSPLASSVSVLGEKRVLMVIFRNHGGPIAVSSLPHSLTRTVTVPHSYSQHNNSVFVCEIKKREKRTTTHIKEFLHPESLERKRAA